MIKLLSKFFLKTQEDIKSKTTQLIACYAIFLNFVLFIGKFIASSQISSYAVRSDSLNNLGDTFSSIITIIGVQISLRPADKKHPFGHGRVEYLSTMILSSLIISTGISNFKTSFVSLLNNEHMLVVSKYAIYTLVFSIIIKIYMYSFYKYYSKSLESDLLKSSSIDSLGDSLTSAFTLLAILLQNRIPLNIDSISGLLISLLIIKNGLKILIDSSDSVIGKQADSEICDKLIKICLSNSEIKDVHDLIIHDYGKNRKIASLHAEVDGEKNIFYLHECIDSIEREIFKELNIQTTIHLDPIYTNNEKSEKFKNQLLEILSGRNISFHDLRITEKNNIADIYVDLIIDDENRKNIKEIEKEINEKLSSLNNKKINTFITFDL